MNKLTILAWVLCAGFVLAALVAAVGQPQHWERTLALAVVLAVASGAWAAVQTRARTRA